MSCSRPPWRFIRPHSAIGRIGGEVVIRGCQEHFSKNSTSQLAWPHCFLLKWVLPCGGWGRGDALLRTYVSSSEVHQNGICPRLTHSLHKAARPRVGGCWEPPRSLPIALLRLANKPAIIWECPSSVTWRTPGLWFWTNAPWWMGSGWHTFPTGARKWEGKANERCQLQAGGETWTVSSHPALSHGSGGCLCHTPWHTTHQGACGASRGGLSSALGRVAPPRGCDRNWVWVPPPELWIFLLMQEKMSPQYSRPHWSQRWGWA